MELSISKFRNSLTAFCNELQTSCDALKQYVEGRPTPLNSSSSTFIQCLNRRVLSTSSDLNMLESMSFDTVSFEELLGHCSEVYKKNQTDLIDLQHRLIKFGYKPDNDIFDDDDEMVASGEPMSPAGSNSKIFQENLLWEEDSLTLQNLGLSDVCLKTVAVKEEVDNNELLQCGVPKDIITVQKEEYETLPSYMKNLASWEDLLAAVVKINTSLNLTFKEEGRFQQDELAKMKLGAKGRCYLLLLVRLKCLNIETVDGVVFYKVL